MKDPVTPTSGVMFDIPDQPNMNASLTIADHLLVSKEAQAIIGGVVGFWGGVFGMGSVYLLVVFLRRLRKNLRNHRKNTASFPRPDKSAQRLQTGYSAMFGHARTDTSIDLMDIPAPAQQSTAAQNAPASGAPNPPAVPDNAGNNPHHQHQQRMPKQKQIFHKSSSNAFGLGSSMTSSDRSASGFVGTSGGTRLKFSGFGLGAMGRDENSGMADCQL